MVVDQIKLKHQGSFGCHDYLVKAYKQNGDSADNSELSLWHDLPCWADEPKGIVNYVCEIPRGTRDKFEISTSETGNPIKQDLDKKGNLRQYKRGDVFFNYGAIPRTWEDPHHMLDVGLPNKVGGDNDPLDVCEIGLRKGKIGEVRQVKVLGVLCMIDDGEADWKVICIDSQDPWAAMINDVSDVEKKLPGVLDDIRNWWRVYKVCEGKPENIFGFDEKFMDRNFALDVINETHSFWLKMAKNVVLEKNPAPMAHCGKRQISVKVADKDSLSDRADNSTSEDDEKKRGEKRSRAPTSPAGSNN
jgi:inorganic pyrophosphatase